MSDAPLEQVDQRGVGYDAREASDAASIQRE